MTSIFDLAEENPWWTKADSIDQDMHIKTFDSSSIKWIPGIKSYINLDVPDYVLYTVRGPRQVGKTTLIKLLIREKLQSGIDPLQIFFWRCDMISAPQKLEGIIRAYINHIRSQTKEHIYLFIDEVTSVRDWQIAIKSLFDGGVLKNVTIVACGSHAMDVKAGAERLPGRTGRGDTVQHKRLVPMKFAEFIRCYDQELAKEFHKKGLHKGEKRRKILVNLIEGAKDDDFSWLLMQKKDLDKLLETYMLTGGIARAINEYKNTSNIQNGTYTDYIAAFQSDLSHWKRDLTTAKNILSEIIKAMGSKSHWNSLTDGVASQPTIKTYVDNMYDCFALAYFHHLRVPSKASKATKKGKKIYLLDPFIFHSLRYWASSVGPSTAMEMSMDYLSKEENRGILIESIVADHLIRFSFNLNPSDPFDARDEIFFYEPNKSEIDFIVNTNKGLLPVESKYRKTIPNFSIRLVNQFAEKQKNKGFVVTKDEFKECEYAILIPASLFLALI